MHEPRWTSLDERAARRVILAQAIEVADHDGHLLSPSERDRIDMHARQSVVAAAGEDSVAPGRFLDVRARELIHAIEGRQPALAALQHGGSWPGWLTVALPLGAVALGVLTDVVANPHRVDLLSLPLLGLVAWNLVMYVLLLVEWLLHGRARRDDPDARAARGEGLLRWRRGRSGALRAEATALFQLRWQRASGALSLQRLKRVLHLSAAGWAIGVSLSLLARGLVVEYRVGWESTFLDATQVHAILSLLRLPALLLFPFEPFTVQEVAGLQFSHGGGAAAGARWVFMYVALLVVVVVVPRLALAAWAWWRERRLARRVRIDVRDPYFQRLLSLLKATRVQLGLLTHRPADREALLRLLARDAQPGGALVASPQGDQLRLVDLSGVQPPRPRLGMLSRVRRVFATAGDSDLEPAQATARHVDAVLHVAAAPDDIGGAQPLLDWLGKPVLVLVAPGGLGAPGLERQAREQPLVREVLPFSDFAGSWVRERVLIDAIGRCLPESMQPGYARIAGAWEEREALRLRQAMTAIAEHLLQAATQSQEVAGAALGLKSVVPAERDAQARARQRSMDQIVERLEVSAGELFSRLRTLYDVPVTDAVALQHRLQDKFVVQHAVDLPQAGMAGAASGAAMGASVDLLVGGLTLGAATALGALVGGGAATIAAAWKNRATPGGSTVVQLSDEMLQALAEAALLRYLAVAQYGRAASGDPSAWTAAVVAAVQAHRDRLAPFWTMARTQPEPGRLVSTLARELEPIARELLAAM